jgi:hypothetical protein
LVIKKLVSSFGKIIPSTIQLANRCTINFPNLNIFTNEILECNQLANRRTSNSCTWIQTPPQMKFFKCIQLANRHTFNSYKLKHPHKWRYWSAFNWSVNIHLFLTSSNMWANEIFKWIQLANRGRQVLQVQTLRQGECKLCIYFQWKVHSQFEFQKKE